jgi:AAA domain
MKVAKATRQARRVRMALSGPPGSGKTYTALRLGARLGTSIGVIDTEAGSATDYADVLFDGERIEFVTVDLSREPGRFSVDNYIAAMKAMADAGVDVLIVDSLSHAWAGAGGILELVDRLGSSKAGGKFAAWADATPTHQRLVDALLNYPGHVVVTMRTKVEWVLEENQRGKQAPRKVGLAPIQRDGIEYEFAIVGELAQDHTLSVTKSRLGDFLPVGSMWPEPGADLAERIHAWLVSRIPTVRELLDTHGFTMSTEELDRFLVEHGGKPMLLRPAEEQARVVAGLQTEKGRAKLDAWLDAQDTPPDELPPEVDEEETPVDPQPTPTDRKRKGGARG